VIELEEVSPLIMMKSMRRKWVLLILLLVIFSTVREATAGNSDGMYLGIGPSWGNISSDALTNDHNLSGFSFVWGFRGKGIVSPELVASGYGNLRTKQTVNIYYPEDTAEYTILNFNMKFDLLSLPKRGWTPWVSLGYAVHILMWDSYFYDQLGGGFAPGCGFDVVIKNGLMLRGHAFYYSAKMKDNYDYDGPDLKSNEFTVMLLYEFGRKKIQKSE